jgi:hypothetical protein
LNPDMVAEAKFSWPGTSPTAGTSRLFSLLAATVARLRLLDETSF